MYIRSSLAMLILLCTSANAECVLRDLKLADHVDLGGGKTLLFGDGGQDWPEGPVHVISNGKQQCSVPGSVAILRSPLIATNSGYFYVNTYSGSSSPLYLIRITDCSIQWTGSGNWIDPKFSNKKITFRVIGADEKPQAKRLSLNLDDRCIPIQAFTPQQSAPTEANATSSVTTPALDSGYRWTTGYGQGTSEDSIISNDSSAIFRIYCADGQSPQSTGIELERKDGHIFTGTKIVQVLVDEKTFQFELVNGSSTSDAMSQKNDLINLVDLLLKEKTASFTVSIPALHWGKIFNTAGAREALTVPTATNRNATSIDACVQP